MAEYTARLKKHEEVAHETMAFSFEKPEGLDYKAGQSAEWILTDSPEDNSGGESRTLSFASAPHEQDIMLATRMRDSAFKRALSEMEPGGEIRLKGPQGSFKLHNDETTPAVFLTGGIGATAVRSIVLQALHDRVPHRIHLFYSNRRPEDAAFLQEFEASRDANPEYTFVPTMTAMEESNREWDGETGHIDKNMLTRYIDDLGRPIYYIDGPPDMVEDLARMLEDAGVSDDNIRTEEFSGY